MTPQVLKEKTYGGGSARAEDYLKGADVKNEGLTTIIPAGAPSYPPFRAPSMDTTKKYGEGIRGVSFEEPLSILVLGEGEGESPRTSAGSAVYLLWV
jgi:hypothetical protein